MLGWLATKPSGAVGSSTLHPSEYLMVFYAGMIYNRAHNQARLWIRPQWIRKTKKENDRGVRQRIGEIYKTNDEVTCV